MSDPWPIPAVPEDEQRTIRFKPAFHRCHPEPSKNYGIGSVTMLWILRVGDWAVTWDAHTDWGLPEPDFKLANPTCEHPMHQTGYPTAGAQGGAVDWHSPRPLWDGHEPRAEACPITGAACYLNTGYLLGSELFDLLRTDGDQAVWRRMRQLLDEEAGVVGHPEGTNQ